MYTKSSTLFSSSPLFFFSFALLWTFVLFGPHKVQSEAKAKDWADKIDVDTKSSGR